jgi:lysozyme
MNAPFRVTVASLALSAAALVGLVAHEGYTDKAIIPIPGDVPTVGFGTTEGVKMGDSTTPVKALARAYSDITKFEGAVKKCVTVPLYQYEYDAYISLAYNIGTGNFCSSTLVKKLNAQDYEGACREVPRWDRAKGRVVKGLTQRREMEYKKCIGQ